MPKGDFAALVAELRLYILPKPLSPNHRALNAKKKVAISLYYLKDIASIGMVVNSLGTFNRYVTLKGGRRGNPFCYGVLLEEEEGGSRDTVT